MAKQTISPRITDKAREFLADNFTNANSGATYVLDSFQSMYRSTLIELKGRFSRGELMLMLDVMNGTILTAGLCDEVVSNSTDGVALDGLDEKWEVDRDIFFAKLRSLTIFQAATLTIWTSSFWCGGGDDREERDIDAYVKQLI